MNEKSEIRCARQSDLPALRALWRSSFNDDYCMIDAFYRHYFEPERTAVTESGGKAVSAGYLLPAGKLRIGQCAVQCAYIYAVATQQEYRGRGFGEAVTRRLVKIGHDTGYPAVAICPASDSLFDYYNTKIGFRDFFYMRERRFTKSEIYKLSEADGLLRCVGEREYSMRRKSILEGSVHIGADLHAISYQKQLCKAGGGGLYTYAARNGASGCAVAGYSADGEVFIKELLVSGIADMDMLAILAEEMPAASYYVRTPLSGLSGSGGKKRFGMLIMQQGYQIDYSNPGWFSMAFD